MTNSASQTKWKEHNRRKSLLQARLFAKNEGLPAIVPSAGMTETELETLELTRYKVIEKALRTIENPPDDLPPYFWDNIGDELRETCIAITDAEQLSLMCQAFTTTPGEKQAVIRVAKWPRPQ